MTAASFTTEPIAEHLDEFVHRHFAPASSGFGLLWSVALDGTKRSVWIDLADPSSYGRAIDTVRAGLDTANWYYGVCARREALGPYRRGRNDECIAQLALVADLDVEGPGHSGDGPYFPDVASAVDVLWGLRAPPTAIVHSGGGVQAHFGFVEAEDPHDPLVAGLRRRLIQTIRRLAGPYAGAVDPVHSADHVMRLPGTWNLKAGLRRPVLLLERSW